MTINKCFIVCHYIHHLLFSFELLFFPYCCLYFLWLFSVPDSTRTRMLTKSPLYLCFPFPCFSFFSRYLSSSLSVPYILLPAYVILSSMNHTFKSEIAKDLEEWDSLDHWRISVLLPGHMVFHSIWKFEFFCTVVVSMWEYQAFQPLNWGLRFITLTLSTYFCPVSYYSWRDE